ncbi:MopE-related protein [Nanoarchaeota archaeon]
MTDMGNKICIEKNEVAECKDIRTQQETFCCTALGWGGTTTYVSTDLAWRPEEDRNQDFVTFTVPGGTDWACDNDQYVHADGSCEFQPPCREHNHCESAYYYCVSEKCEQKSCSAGNDAACFPGYCDTSIGSDPATGGCYRIIECQSDNDCEGADERCIEGNCAKDVDGDGFCHPDIPPEFCGGKIDCHDGSSLCQDDCSKLEGTHPQASDSGFWQTGKRNQDGYDCNDFCIDYDGDGWCSSLSAKKIDQEMVSELVSQGFAESDLTSLGVERVDTAIYDEQYKLDFKEIISSLLGDWNEGQNTFYDCDDEDVSLNPGLFEDDQCDLVNNDCDGTLDECAEPEKQCVYSSGIPGCYDLDFDGDTFKGEHFGCPDCTDCADCPAECHDGRVGPETNPEATEIDNDLDDNCNGVVDEIDENGDGVPETFEIEGPPFTFTEFTLDECPDQDESEGPTAPNGCWFSILKDTLPDWSDGSAS